MNSIDFTVYTKDELISIITGVSKKVGEDVIKEVLNETEV